ncbi:TIGR00269 family protein, partial [Candidatus Woesearchaeota archaeon CG_4_10_14_0_8_um_filter_47_5]
ALSVLHKLGYKVTALLIDEGISGYRKSTIQDMERFCAQKRIAFRIVSFLDSFGFTLDEALGLFPEKNPCTVCGILRRYLLNKAARGFDVLATGHNLDDEAQAILMNLLKNNQEIARRIGPKTGIVADQKFVQRVKPLYFCTEKEDRIYAFLTGIEISFAECLYVPASFRNTVREALTSFEQSYPETKEQVVRAFLNHKRSISQSIPIFSGSVQHCVRCGEPAQGKICSACSFAETYARKKLKK